ncbi:sporulation protein YqfD [Salinibacillus xinjiangensis]|nr:sporulation protein YqfD [Salinibacillus xinjiangensis]
MKFKQGLFFKGYITIQIKGKKPELFLNQCIREDIAIWDIRRNSEMEIEAKVHLKNLTNIRQIRRRLGYKVSLKEKNGLPFILAHLRFRKPLIIGLFLSLVLIFILSNMVWQVKIVGVSPEMEYKIQERLDDYGLKEGVFKFTLRSVDDIERNITNELKDIMWLGIEEKGTTYIVQGVEKTVVDKEQKSMPQHLVASKDGTIMEMLVEKGSPKVAVYQKVKKGDILVSGIIEEGNGNINGEKEDADDQKDRQQYVHSKGTVMAETWYTTETTVPLTYKHQSLTGDKDHHYSLKIGNFSIPIWDFLSPDYKEKHMEKEDNSLYFLNFKLPFSIEKKTIFEKETTTGKRDEKTAIAEGIAQAKRELKKHTNHDAEILDERILHEKVENGKVKLELLFIVKEDIAKPQPINQGE